MNNGTKIKVYKTLIIVFFSIYFLFSIDFLKGAWITYSSLSYYFSNFGFNLDVFNFIRILNYILFFINLVIGICILIKLILNKKIIKISIIFCGIHCLISISWGINYKFLLGSILSIIPIVILLFLCKMYDKKFKS